MIAASVGGASGIVPSVRPTGGADDAAAVTGIPNVRSGARGYATRTGTAPRRAGLRWLLDVEERQARRDA
ncbi:hypothetical protein Mame01_18360 [Microbispora amethystogenes]|nr:hypothetical protein Mame01_18360 [Microbispora amethystogenes]